MLRSPARRRTRQCPTLARHTASATAPARRVGPPCLRGENSRGRAVRRGLGTRCRFQKAGIGTCPPRLAVDVTRMFAVLRALRVLRGENSRRRRPPWSGDTLPIPKSRNRNMSPSAVLRALRVSVVKTAESEHVPVAVNPTFAVLGVLGVLAVKAVSSAARNFALAPNPRLFPAVVSPDGFRVSRPIRRDTTDAPPPLGGPCASGHETTGLRRPGAHASGAAGEHGAGRDAIRRSRDNITWGVCTRSRPETVRSIGRGGLPVRRARHLPQRAQSAQRTERPGETTRTDVAVHLHSAVLCVLCDLCGKRRSTSPCPSGALAHNDPVAPSLQPDRQRMRLQRCRGMVLLGERVTRRGRKSARLMCAWTAGGPAQIRVWWNIIQTSVCIWLGDTRPMAESKWGLFDGRLTEEEALEA